MVRIEFATKDRYRGRRQNGPGAGAIAARSRAPVVAVASRHPERAKAAAEFIGRGVVALAYSQLPSRANHLLIAVPDRAVAQVATMLAGAARGVALHTCGAYGPEALGPLAGSGVSCGSLHPLQTVATAEQGVADLPGVAFAVEGDGPAAIWAREIVDLLEGRVLQISADCRPLYHAAAVMASNYLVGLIDAAAILMRAAGVPEEDALQALGPLARASLKNALGQGPEAALTGPIERGDSGTVSAHLAALTDASLKGFCAAAGLHVLDTARRRGLSPGQAREIEEMLRKCLTA